MQSILMVGFCWHDALYSGMSVMVTTDNDPSLARELAANLADRVWALRRDFQLKMETRDIDDGIRLAEESTRTPVFLSDAGDNTTAGAPGDLTIVLQQLVKLGVRDAVVPGITAPATVRRCFQTGVGGTIEIALGAEHISVKGEVLSVTATVEAVGEELNFQGFQPYRTREGDWARMRIGGLIATFHALPIGITTPQHFEAMGIDPTGHPIFVVKLGYLHPQLEDIAKRHILLYSPGVADLDLHHLEWRRVRRPIFPLDEAMSWTPDLKHLP